jgi:hypothetical protein
MYGLRFNTSADPLIVANAELNEAIADGAPSHALLALVNVSDVNVR